MSGSEIGMNFSHLDEETETDGQQVDSEAFRQNLEFDIIQPHLSLQPPPPASRRRNPRDRGVMEDEARERDHRSESMDRGLEEQPDDDYGTSAVKLSFQFQQKSENDTVNRDNNHNESDNTPDATNPASLPPPSNPTANAASSNGTAAPSSNSTVQICYSKTTGNIGVREVPVVSTRQDGRPYIATQQIPQDWDEAERRPLRKKRIHWIKIFSIVACVLFFPSGLVSAYFAFRINKEFEEGIMRGNIDRAQKFATRSERLSILSIVLCILTAALIVTLIERPQFQSEHYHRGAITG